MQIDVDNLKPGQAEALALSYSVLAKDKEDLERLQQPLPSSGRSRSRARPSRP